MKAAIVSIHHANAASNGSSAVIVMIIVSWLVNNVATSFIQL
jgi:hypothetical protein